MELVNWKQHWKTWNFVKHKPPQSKLHPPPRRKTNHSRPRKTQAPRHRKTAIHHNLQTSKKIYLNKSSFLRGATWRDPLFRCYVLRFLKSTKYWIRECREFSRLCFNHHHQPPLTPLPHNSNERRGRDVAPRDVPTPARRSCQMKP